MALGMYILDGHTPVRERNLLHWAMWFEQADQERVVARTEHELFRVSTVFLGLDHSFGRRSPPILFETMVFADDFGDEIECARYASWDDAEIGHKAIVRKMLKLVKRSTPSPADHAARQREP